MHWCRKLGRNNKKPQARVEIRSGPRGHVCMYVHTHVRTRYTYACRRTTPDTSWCRPKQGHGRRHAYMHTSAHKHNTHTHTTQHVTCTTGTPSRRCIGSMLVRCYHVRTHTHTRIHIQGSFAIGSGMVLEHIHTHTCLFAWRTRSPCHIHRHTCPSPCDSADKRLRGQSLHTVANTHMHKCSVTGTVHELRENRHAHKVEHSKARQKR